MTECLPTTTDAYKKAIDLLNNGASVALPTETVYGDNRDNSEDSRAPLGPGFVPVDHLIGRAEYMVFSFKKCETEEGLKCPGRRSFLKL